MQDINAVRGPVPKGEPVPRRYLLAGLLACGVCGRRMESAWTNGKPAYRCRHGRTSDPGSGNRQAERMPRRVGQRDPDGAADESGGTERYRALCRFLVPVGQQVEVNLLGAFLPRPLRRNVLGNLLEGNLLPTSSSSGLARDSLPA